PSLAIDTWGVPVAAGSDPGTPPQSARTSLRGGPPSDRHPAPSSRRVAMTAITRGTKAPDGSGRRSRSRSGPGPGESARGPSRSSPGVGDRRPAGPAPRRHGRTLGIPQRDAPHSTGGDEEKAPMALLPPGHHRPFRMPTSLPSALMTRPVTLRTGH